MAENRSTPTSRFLEDVAEQISYQPLRPAVTQELKDHIQDRMDACIADGMKPEDAEKKAVSMMGDAVAIGTELNAVRHTRTSFPLLALTAFLMLCGGLAAAYLRWSPEPYANGFRYYIPGIVLLLLVTFKGYPWLVRYQKWILRLAIFLYAAEFLWILLFEYYPQLPSDLYSNGLNPPFHMITYYEVLLFAPILVITVYRMRRKPTISILILMLAASFFIWFQNYAVVSYVYSITLIFLTTILATIFFMIHRRIFSAPRRRLALIAAGGFLLPLGIFITLPSQNYLVQAFAAPETVTVRSWDDSYNGLLIKNLLSRTPAVSGISLTPEELMDYCTGSWYFESPGMEHLRMANPPKDEAQDAEWEKDWRNHRNYILQNHNESNVTLWDILPQHYHNNYLITCVILLYGWLPGLCFLALPVLFYIGLFRCIQNIHGKLASSTAFCCGVALLMQGILYLLGNLGYQYETFPNLPLISEGRLSILANMLLLGFIFSAYRYDRVIDETASSAIAGGE